MPKSNAKSAEADRISDDDATIPSGTTNGTTSSAKGMGQPLGSWSDLGRQGGMSLSDRATYDDAARKALACALPVMLPLVVINYMDRSAISFTGSAIISNLGISEYEFGLASGIFYIPYVALQLPSLWIANFVSVRAWLCGLTLLWGVSTLLTGTATTFAELAAYRFLLGAAEAGTFPLLYYYLDLFFTPRDLAQLWGNGVIVATQVSSVIAAPIATLILTTLDGAAGQDGWRWVYFILGGMALTVGVLLGVCLIDPPETTAVFTREEKAVIARMKADVTDTELDSKVKPDLLAGLQDWRSLYLGLIALLQNGVTITFFIFTPIVIESLLLAVGETPEDSYIFSVALTTVPYAIAVILLNFVSYILRHQPPSWRCWTGIGTMVATIVLLAGLELAFETNQFLLAFFVFSFALGANSSIIPVIDTLPGFYLQQKGGSSSYFAVLNTFRSLSAIWTPAIVGYLIPMAGAAATVQFVGLLYLAPTLVLFIAWFYGINQDVPLILSQPKQKVDPIDQASCAA